MPPYVPYREYPRVLYKGTLELRVHDEMACKKAEKQGWKKTPPPPVVPEPVGPPDIADYEALVQQLRAQITQLRNDLVVLRSMQREAQPA